MIPVIGHHEVVVQLFRKHFGDRPFTGIEIGTAGAGLTTTLLMNFQNVKIQTIDPWVHVEGSEFEAGEPQAQHDETRAAANRRLEEFKDRVDILPMTSREAFEILKDHDFGMRKWDFVWIDGDHSEATIKFDTENYLSLVKEGGIFGGHDYGLVHPLTEIIMRKFGGHLNSGNDYTWWVYV